MTSKKTLSQPDLKIFHVYLIGQAAPQKIKATGYKIHHKSGEIEFLGITDTNATWRFFLHGVAAIKEDVAA